MSILIAAAVVLGVGVLVLAYVLAAAASSSDLPSLEPCRRPPPNPALSARLFRPEPWRRAALAQAIAPAAPLAYERPMNLDPMPDDRVLPPPREIDGVANE